MKRGQIAIVAAAVGAVGLIALLGSGHGNSRKSGATAQSPAIAAPGALRVSFVYSPEKASLMQKLINDYNASMAAVSGMHVFIDGRSVSSGAAEAGILAGTFQPVLWSPAGSVWGRLLNFQADKAYVPDVNPSIVRTPLVIAIWENEARALGWPQKQLGFADLANLARSRTGWAAFGHPEYGRFALVHTNPDFSTAGLESVVAEYYAVTGKTEGLQSADLTGAAHQKVRQLERSIVHYGDTTLFVADHLVAEGPGYASAAIVEESVLLDVNRRLSAAHTGQKMVAIYPKEGTFYSDSPAIILRAPWVSPDQSSAARSFQRYLASHIDPELAARYGFRPSDPNARPVAPITTANGVDPSQPRRVLGLPQPRVLAAVKRSWFDDRKAANILLVLDTSGSMNDQNRLANAKAGISAFLQGAGPQDHVGLTAFSDQLQALAPILTLRQSRARLLRLVNGIVASGGTALYDATSAAFAAVRKLADTSRINAVVLLTDGEDTDSRKSAGEVTAELQAQGDSSRKVRVFTIAYSADAAGSQQILARISQISGGQAYTGTPANVGDLYRSISSFF